MFPIKQIFGAHEACSLSEVMSFGLEAGKAVGIRFESLEIVGIRVELSKVLVGINTRAGEVLGIDEQLGEVVEIR